MISLEAALERLLRSPTLRRALRGGRCDALEVASDDADELLAIDPDELDAAARAFTRSVRTRSHRGCMNLERAFASTLSSFRALHPEDAELDGLFSAFTASPAFDATPADGEPMMEARFWRFLTDAGVGDACTRDGELLAATMRSLATAGDEGHRLPPQVHRCAGGWLAVEETGPSPRLFAACRGRTITGPVSIDVADVLLGRRVGAPATRAALTSMGLLD